MTGDKLMFLWSLKKDEKYDAANYRPVSLTCTMYTAYSSKQNQQPPSLT